MMKDNIDHPQPQYQKTKGYWHAVLRQLKNEPLAIISAGILLVLIIAALFAPWLAPADPFKASMLKRLMPIGSPGNLLGTDELGRDMLTRLM